MATNDTLYAAMQDQRKRKLRDVFRAMLTGATAGVDAAQGVPVSPAVRAARETFALDKTDPRAEERMWAIGMLTDLQKSKDAIQIAQEEGKVAALRAKYEAADKILGYYADMLQAGVSGSATVAGQKASALGAEMLELRRQMGETGVLGVDMDRVRTDGAALAEHFAAIAEGGTGWEAVGSDPTQGLSTSIDALMKDGSDMHVFAVTEYADQLLRSRGIQGPTLESGLPVGVLAGMFDHGVMPDGSTVDVSSGTDLFANTGIQPFYKVKGMRASGGARISEESAGIEQVGSMLGALDAEMKKTWGSSGKREVEWLHEFGVRAGLISDPDMQASTDEDVAGGASRAPGGMGNLDKPAPSLAEEELIKYLESLDDNSNPTAIEKKAEILASEDFKGWMSRRDLTTPEEGWKQLKAEAKAAHDDATLRDQSVRGRIGTPTPDLASVEPPEPRVEPRGAARTGGRPSRNVAEAERDQYGMPVDPNKKKGEEDPIQRLNNDLKEAYRKKSEVRLGRV